ncbi:MAG: lysostaphin resistance A-like protein [Christensenellales bacterium]
MIYFISLVLFVGIRIIFNLGFLGKMSEVWQELISTLLIQVLVMFLVPFLFYLLFFKKKPKEAFSNFGYKKISFKAVVICVLIGLIAFALNIVISSIFNGIIHAFGYNSSGGSSASDYSILSFFVNILCVAILPALCEEFIHRGLLMRGMFNSISVKHALILSSICFGLMHLNITQVFYASILGLLIGFVSIVGKSIWPAVIIHFVNNFVNVYLSFAQHNDWIFGNFYDAISNFISNNFLISLIVIIIGICAMLYLLFKLIMSLLKITSFESFKNVIVKLKRNLNKDIVNYSTGEEVNETHYIGDIEPIILDNLMEPKNMADLFLQDIYPKEELGLKDKIFVIASLFLGVMITIFTFVWGIL